MLAIFEIGSHFIPKWAWTVNLLFVLPHVAGVTGTPHHTQPFIEMKSDELFASNHNNPNLCLLGS
jgi:hypothetical protein